MGYQFCVYIQGHIILDALNVPCEKKIPGTVRGPFFHEVTNFNFLQNIFISVNT